uniref:AMP-binding protein n=1 Tax=Prevotella sp. GTC17262 TaxID=3236797 RepID=A0AB33JLZ3_9BACT
MVLEEFLAEWHNDSPTILVHTSGSTGKPKPMWVEKYRMLNSARITCDFLGLKEGDTALLCMPLDYIAGKMVVVRSLERHLRLITVEPSGHPLKGLKTSPAFAAMIPMQVYNSLQVTEEAACLRGIRQLIIGGGAIDPSLAEALRDFPHHVWSTYGMTETLSHIALRHLNEPQADTWYQTFDSVHVSLNADGCLVIDAPQVCAKPLVTNDLAELSPDGQRFRIFGRKDNVIDTGGIKVQIEDVESRLRPHLHDAFIITKRPDKKFGEIIVLLTESKDLEPIRQLCQHVLPKYWQPKLFKTIDHIPTTETGKPARKEAELLANN